MPSRPNRGGFLSSALSFTFLVSLTVILGYVGFGGRSAPEHHVKPKLVHNRFLNDIPLAFTPQSRGHKRKSPVERGLQLEQRQSGCNTGEKSCGADYCIPQSGVCCDTQGHYCFAGNMCEMIHGALGCCTNSQCTAEVGRDGITTPVDPNLPVNTYTYTGTGGGRVGGTTTYGTSATATATGSSSGNCGTGKKSCGADYCIPESGVCCNSQGYYCYAGNMCETLRGDLVCCTNQQCTAEVGKNGVTTPVNPSLSPTGNGGGGTSSAAFFSSTPNLFTNETPTPSVVVVTQTVGGGGQTSRPFVAGGTSQSLAVVTVTSNPAKPGPRAPFVLPGSERAWGVSLGAAVLGVFALMMWL